MTLIEDIGSKHESFSLYRHGAEAEHLLLQPENVSSCQCCFYDTRRHQSTDEKREAETKQSAGLSYENVMTHDNATKGSVSLCEKVKIYKINTADSTKICVL